MGAVTPWFGSALIGSRNICSRPGIAEHGCLRDRASSTALRSAFQPDVLSSTSSSLPRGPLRHRRQHSSIFAIDRVAKVVDGPVEIRPTPARLDICLVDVPPASDGSLAPLEPLQQFGRSAQSIFERSRDQRRSLARPSSPPDFGG